MPEDLWLWGVFNVFVLGMLALDLGVFHRKAHIVQLREALTWSVVWIGLALSFNLWIFLSGTAKTPDGSDAGMKFLTGYLIEKALSMDNVFLFYMLFTYFHVPPLYQHRVLFWGIFGALIMRALLIWAGIELITKFHWTIYIFGVFLIITGIKMAWAKDKEIHPEKNPLLRLFRWMIPVTPDYHAEKFWVKTAGRWMATPLFVVLLLIETTDLIFAVDSIPAILAVTTDPFLVYTSNVFAILGLRSLYFALAGLASHFHFLAYGLSAILVFAGTKMLLVETPFKVPITYSLALIVLILALSVVASLLFPKKESIPSHIQTL
jgi:tellurite resistance protein TerC